jgi:hypothetical protein
VRAIDAFEGELAEAFAPQSVTLRLEHEVDVSRGDMLFHSEDLPRVARTFDAHLVWMHDAALDLGRSYLLKHTTQTVRADVERVHWRKDMDTLGETPAATLALNDIGRVTLTAHRELFLDPYHANRETGSFILIDTLSNGTVAAGMILGETARVLDPSNAGAETREASAARSLVTDGVRRARFGASGGMVLVTAPTDSQADALAFAVERRLFECGASGAVIRGRGGPSSLAAAGAVRDAGLIALVPTSSPIVDRPSLAGSFDRPRLLVIRADVGAKASGAGEESRKAAGDDIVVDLDAASLDKSADAVVAALRDRGWIGQSIRSS